MTQDLDYNLFYTILSVQNIIQRYLKLDPYNTLERELIVFCETSPAAIIPIK